MSGVQQKNISDHVTWTKAKHKQSEKNLHAKGIQVPKMKQPNNKGDIQGRP